MAYTGTFNGTSTLHGILILHPDGSAHFHDIEIFTGTVNGKPGTVTFHLHGSSDRANVVSATDAIVSGTGALANLRGTLRERGMVGDAGPVGTYTGTLHIDDDDGHDHGARS